MKSTHFEPPFRYEPMYHGYGIFRTVDGVLVERCNTLERAEQLVWHHELMHREPNPIIETLKDWWEEGAGLVVYWIGALIATMWVLSSFVIPLIP